MKTIKTTTRPIHLPEDEDTTMNARDELAETLTAHQRQNASHCLCGWSKLGASHPAHQAAVLATLIVAAQAEALREAADEVERLVAIGKKPFGQCTPAERDVYNTYVHASTQTWLRARATEVRWS